MADDKAADLTARRTALVLAVKRRGWLMSITKVPDDRGGGLTVTIMDPFTLVTDRLRYCQQATKEGEAEMLQTLLGQIDREFPLRVYSRAARAEAYSRRFWPGAVLAMFLPVALSCLTFTILYSMHGFAEGAAVGLLVYLGSIWPSRILCGTHKVFRTGTRGML